jgi:hypothetical protein
MSCSTVIIDILSHGIQPLRRAWSSRSPLRACAASPRLRWRRLDLVLPAPIRASRLSPMTALAASGRVRFFRIPIDTNKEGYRCAVGVSFWGTDVGLGFIAHRGWRDWREVHGTSTSRWTRCSDGRGAQTTDELRFLVQLVHGDDTLAGMWKGLEGGTMMNMMHTQCTMI